MATQTQLLILLGVFAIILGVIWFNFQRARSAAAAPTEPTTSSWIAKFVHHDGSVVGETVALDGDHLVLKQAGVFRSVPRAQATEKDGEIVLSGGIDWIAAAALGAAWHERNTRGHDPSVTERLTTSDDVRAPALEAFQRRQEEE